MSEAESDKANQVEDRQCRAQSATTKTFGIVEGIQHIEDGRSGLFLSKLAHGRDAGKVIGENGSFIDNDIVLRHVIAQVAAILEKVTTVAKVRFSKRSQLFALPSLAQSNSAPNAKPNEERQGRDQEARHYLQAAPMQKGA
jgi:predicted RNA-binding protein YlqC (UPF0109 family)